MLTLVSPAESPAPSVRVVWIPARVVSASTTDNSIPFCKRLMSSASLVASPSTVALPDTFTVSVPSVLSPSLRAVNWKVPVAVCDPAGMLMVKVSPDLSVQKSPLGGVGAPLVAPSVSPLPICTATEVGEVLVEEVAPANPAVTVTLYGSLRSATVAGDTEMSRSLSASFNVRVTGLTTTATLGTPPTSNVS